ncbi:MAG: GAK system XXXCH domain-containing protein [Methanobacteriota archaeon]|nr:MAG: GAK system XXXCH domain-containing protein [Euryarchaeota archaeon]
MKGMKFEEKKRMGKGEVAGMLKGLGEMMERDELRISGRDLAVPDDAEVEVEYKEGHGKARLEIEVKWRIQEGAGRTAAGEGGKADGVSIGEVKGSIRGSFKAIRAALESGELPPEEALRDFMAQNRVFRDLARGREYEEDMEGYMELVERLRGAVEDRELEGAKALVEEIREAKKSCHRTYRWKEG